MFRTGRGGGRRFIITGLLLLPLRSLTALPMTWGSVSQPELPRNLEFGRISLRILRKKNRLHMQMLEYREKFRISRKISREVCPGIGNTGVISACNILPLYVLPCECFHRETLLKIRKIIIRVPPWQKHWPKLSALYRCLSSIWLHITVMWYTRSLPVSFTALCTISFYNVLRSFFVNSSALFTYATFEHLGLEVSIYLLKKANGVKI